MICDAGFNTVHSYADMSQYTLYLKMKWIWKVIFFLVIVYTIDRQKDKQRQTIIHPV